VSRSLPASSQYDSADILICPNDEAFGPLWNTICPNCRKTHGKDWHIETDLCKKCQQQSKYKQHMHYANGREAKNGDRVLRISEGWQKPIVGILHDAVAGNDNCNGNLAVPVNDQAGCNLAECLHIDDVRAAIGDIKSVPDQSK